MRELDIVAPCAPQCVATAALLIAVPCAWPIRRRHLQHEACAVFIPCKRTFTGCPRRVAVLAARWSHLRLWVSVELVVPKDIVGRPPIEDLLKGLRNWICARPKAIIVPGHRLGASIHAAGHEVAKTPWLVDPWKASKLARPGGTAIRSNCSIGLEDEPIIHFRTIAETGSKLRGVGQQARAPQEKDTNRCHAKGGFTTASAAAAMLK